MNDLLVKEQESGAGIEDYFAPKLCVKCQKYNADEGETDCKFCFRKGKTAGFSNMSTQWGRNNNLDNHQAGDHS